MDLNTYLYIFSGADFDRTEKLIVPSNIPTLKYLL